MKVLILVLLAVSSVPAAYAVCESIHECMYANLEPDTVAKIVVPSETLPLAKNENNNVRIFGTVPIDNSIIRLMITHPDGTANNIEFDATDDGLFSTWYTIGGKRSDEGIYKVEGTYHIEPEKDDDEEEIEIEYHEFDWVSFKALVAGIQRGDYTITINPNADDKICSKDDVCYDDADIVIRPGQTVEWLNTDDATHRIHSIATAGIGEEPEIIQDPRNTPNFFDVGIMEREQSAFVTFDEQGTVLYSCLFHPWMEGTLSVFLDEDDVKKPVQSVLEIKEEEEAKAHSILWGDITRQLTNAGDLLSVEYSFSDEKKRSAFIRIIDDEDNTVKKGRVTSDRQGRTLYEVMVQPTWKPGEYEFSVSPYSKKLEPRSVQIDISQGAAECPSVDLSKIKKHGPSSGCFADRVGVITGNDTLTVGRTDVTLTVSLPTTRTNGTLADLCPPGSIAVVDKDTTLKLDSRVSKSLRGEYFGVVYCGDVNVNRHLLKNNLAEVDPVGCITTEFQEWGQCPVIETVTEITEQAQQAAEDNCMIAFAVRGTELAHTVQVLREYRQGMINSGLGPAFDAIHTAYYAISPSITEMMRDNPDLHHAVYSALKTPLLLAVQVL